MQRHVKRLMVGVVIAWALAACGPVLTATPSAVPPAATVTAAPPATVTAPPPSPTVAAATPTSAPSVEAGPALVAGQWSYLFYHPGLERVVLVNGGPDRGQPNSHPLELWAWDGAQWTRLSADPDGPRWRNFASAAFDTARNVLVIHGGVQTRGAWLDDTWEWDGQTWAEVTSPGPGQREGAEMAYDAARGVALLFGGATTGGVIAGDTWAWDGQSWTQAATPTELGQADGPAPRFPNAMVYDAARAQLLLYGGHYVGDTDFAEYGDLWAWDGAAWHELSQGEPAPGYRIVSRLVYDPGTARVLVFGGGARSFLTDMWAWDGAAWAQIALDGAPVRSGMSGAYDPVRDVVVAFGGIERPGGSAVTDTWEWDRQAWRCVHGCP